MQICLYIDEDAMARALVNGLRARGIDVVTVLDARMAGQSDPAQLAFAAQAARAIFTFNVGHFCQLHTTYQAQGKTHAGIIVVARQKYPIGEQLKRLAALVRSKTATEMQNNLHFL